MLCLLSCIYACLHWSNRLCTLLTYVHGRQDDPDGRAGRTQNCWQGAGRHPCAGGLPFKPICKFCQFALACTVPFMITAIVETLPATSFICEYRAIQRSRRHLRVSAGQDLFCDRVTWLNRSHGHLSSCIPACMCQGTVCLKGLSRRLYGFYNRYVEQNDIHSPATTVAEALLFSASLRLPRDLPKADTKAFAREIMGVVELEALEHSLVGLPGGHRLGKDVPPALS